MSFGDLKKTMKDRGGHQHTYHGNLTKIILHVFCLQKLYLSPEINLHTFNALTTSIIFIQLG